MKTTLLCLAVSLCAVPAANAAGGGADIWVALRHLAPARPADTYGFDATVTNDGPETARNVEASILLPPGAIVRKQDACERPREQALGIVRCRFGDLAPGAEGRVFILVEIADPVPAVMAIAVSDTPDPNASNNMDSGYRR